MDWLMANECEWQFAKSTMFINGRPVALHSRTARTAVRRIYARERIVIEPNSQTIVPVRMPYLNLHAVETD